MSSLASAQSLQCSPEWSEEGVSPIDRHQYINSSATPLAPCPGHLMIFYRRNILLIFWEIITRLRHRSRFKDHITLAGPNVGPEGYCL
ncbi:hypothetical protein ElyMa_006897300 [Elysia marginata]|uniref:Uncharacterized protein n=1 Tax=Elysia marginata TaxID=1093978 RepID=A0AAV4JG37_9GAST|nr:hypothetical protein ElyMa_006897300 [Elysia marginata]